MRRKVVAPLVTATMIALTNQADAAVCKPGESAADYDSWSRVEENAVQTANKYAAARRSDAFFDGAKIEATYQIGGEYKGEYILHLTRHRRDPLSSSYAMLLPNFDFCSDPATLDNQRDDLFTVVYAKHNLVEF